MKLPLNTDLTGKTVVITGAGGVLGGMFAKALAQAGGKVALLDLNQEAAKKAAKEISEEGYIAKGYAANVLQKESLAAAHEQIKKDFYGNRIVMFAPLRAEIIRRQPQIRNIMCREN